MDQIAVEITGNEVEESVEPQQRNITKDNLIIITGFGPFIGHETVNASWEAVRLLPNHLHYKGKNFLIEKRMIDVEYEAVDKAVNEIWQCQPYLVIHCGVHGASDCVRVERLAYNHKFKRPDYAGKYLDKGTAYLDNCRSKGLSDKVLFCGLNVPKIVNAIAEYCNVCDGDTASLSQAATSNSSDGKVAVVSSNVGDYLCGYIYLKSLDVNRERSLFIHVPPIGKPFNSEQTSTVIWKIVEECVRQVEEDCKC